MWDVAIQKRASTLDRPQLPGMNIIQEENIELGLCKDMVSRGKGQSGGLVVIKERCESEGKV